MLHLQVLDCTKPVKMGFLCGPFLQRDVLNETGWENAKLYLRLSSEMVFEVWDDIDVGVFYCLGKWIRLFICLFVFGGSVHNKVEELRLRKLQGDYFV